MALPAKCGLLLTPLLLLIVAATTQASAQTSAQTSAQASTQASTQALTPSDFSIAIRQKEATVVMRGAGSTCGDVLRIFVQNRTDQDRIWTIPPGQIAVSRVGPATAMAIRIVKGRAVDAKRYRPAAIIQLKAGEKAVFVCEAYSLEFAKPTPSRLQTFRFDPVRPSIARLFQNAQDTRPTVRALQIAVWLLSEDLNETEIQKTFPVTPKERAHAKRLARMSRDSLEASASLSPENGSAPTSLPTFRESSRRDSEAVPEVPLVEIALSPTSAVWRHEERMWSVLEVRYRWTVPPESRSRYCIVACRGTQADATPIVHVAGLRLHSDEGGLTIVVERNAYSGAAPLALAVFDDLTVAAPESVIDALFDEVDVAGKHRISNLAFATVQWSCAKTSPDPPPPFSYGIQVDEKSRKEAELPPTTPRQSEQR